MLTERLDYGDAYLTEFDAQVVARRNEHTVVALDRSAFYPAGGGQPADHGTLNGIAVRDVQAEDGVVWHTLAAPLTDDLVHGALDSARRFDHMQQHHGQHLLSAAFENLYGLQTTAFHLGAATTTIDLAAPTLSAAQTSAVEELVNQVITEARPVLARFVTPAELSHITLRKPPTVSANVRVVSVPGFDHSACGGTHPRTTGGVGLLHIRRWERRGGGVRLEFLCGGRALHDYRARDALVLRLASAFDGPPDAIETGIERLRVAEERARRQLAAMGERLLGYEAQELIACADPAGVLRVVRRAFDGREVEELRALAQAIAAGGCVALLGTRAAKTQLIFASPPGAAVDCGALLRAALVPFGGRGGGQAALAQGGLPDGAQLDLALAAAAAALAS